MCLPFAESLSSDNRYTLWHSASKRFPAVAIPSPSPRSQPQSPALLAFYQRLSPSPLLTSHQRPSPSPSSPPISACRRLRSSPHILDPVVGDFLRAAAPAPHGHQPAALTAPAPNIAAGRGSPAVLPCPISRAAVDLTRGSPTLPPSCVGNRRPRIDVAPASAPTTDWMLEQRRPPPPQLSRNLE